MKCIPTTLLLTSALAYVLGSTSVSAQNENFAAGDLVVYFQKFGGGDTVYANMGNAATLFRGAAAGPGASNRVDFLNVNTELTSAFGAGWASDPDVYAGLAGVWGANVTNNTLQDGDPHRTLYISSSRTAVGTVGQPSSNGWNLYTAGNTAMTGGANAIYTQNNVLKVSFDEAVEVVPVAISQIDNQNPFVNQEIQDNAFATFQGGVQQHGTAGSFGSFGAAGNVEFALDLYRILAKNTISGQVAGELRIGSFEGTVTVNSSGMVSFISQGTATSAYDGWMDDFTDITAPAAKLPAADPDGDGATNLEEFGFGGDPGNGADQGLRLIQTVDTNSDSKRDLTLTLEVRSGATFSAAGNDLVSGTVDELTYRIEGSTDLATWDSAVSEVTPAIGSGSPSTGYVFKTFRLDNGGAGLTGKGFLRAVVTK
jgi:hypothetical protein